MQWLIDPDCFPIEILSQNNTYLESDGITDPLRQAVSYVNFGKLRFKTESQQQIWNECSRLITNCIIYYNAIILSALLRLKEQRGEDKEVALLERVSPVAWQHINFYGRYEFTNPPEQIDVEAMAQELALFPIQSVPVSPSLD